MQITTRPIKALSISLVAVLLTTSLSTGIVGATALVPTIKAEAKQSEFCSNLQAKANAVDGRLATLQQNVASVQTKHVTNLQNNWNTFGTKLSGLQAQWRTDRDTEYAKLMSFAKNDAQKAAVTAFETTLNDAIATRESDNAQARTDYQNGVLAAAKVEGDSISAAETALQNTVGNQVTSLESTCASGTASPSQSDLNPTITAARKTYQSAVQSARETFQSTVKSLKATETTAIQKNDSNFQTALQSAVSALKSAFGQS